jgi:hypothetical protein
VPRRARSPGVRNRLLNRYLALDALRVGLALCVVAQHAGFLAGYSALGYYLTSDGLFRVAVPIFLLINGFFFYPALSSGRHAAWFRRLACLYAFWMAFYLYLWLRPQALTIQNVGRLVLTLFVGYFHLWYLPCLIGAVLLVFLFKNVRLQISLPVVIILFATGAAIQYAGSYHWFGKAKVDALFNYSPMHRNFLFVGFPFVYIGYLVNKHRLHRRIPSTALVAAVVTGVALLLLESFTFRVSPGKQGGFDNFASLLLICPAIFMLFLKLEIAGSTKDLALFANGIYFIHIWFLVLLQGIAELSGTALTLVVAISSVIGSYLLIKVNERLGFVL